MDADNKTVEATILVVDDNKNNLDLMLATLSEHNYRLLAATSGERALKVASKVLPDLILMDIQMPDMDGFETTKKLKSDPAFANVPVLFLSALNDLKNIVTCFEAGGVDYISKPFQKEELFARIQTHLKLKNLQTRVENDRDKINSILKNILPEKHINKLKNGIKPEPEHVDNAAIIFTDFENFTGLAKDLGPAGSVSALNEIFWGFDEVMQAFGLERVKTIGDAYMAVCGVNNSVADVEMRAALAGIKLQEFISEYNRKKNTDRWKLRVGIHHGPLVSGIIGYQKIAFDTWGDAINLASRLESAAFTTGICTSRSFFDSISDVLILNSREVRTLHNIGEVELCHSITYNERHEEAYSLFNSVDVSLLVDDSADRESLLTKIFDL